MKLVPTAIPDVLLIEPRVFADPRGFFMEVWNQRAFADQRVDVHFVQDNHSRSHRGVLRGLHYQLHCPQGKLVRAVNGTIFDVAVDLRRGSSTFGRWVGAMLSDDNHLMLWIPPGFAHGFYVISDRADVSYKCTEFYHPQSERTLRWDDPATAINWPLIDDQAPLVSEKDAAGLALDAAECFDRSPDPGVGLQQ